MNKENRLTIIVLLAIISFFSFNVLNKNFFKNLRFDLTKSNVYTLSPGTKSILKSINEPLDFKLFYIIFNIITFENQSSNCAAYTIIILLLSLNFKKS